MKRSEAVEEIATLDDVQAHSAVGGENTQDNVISRNNITLCGGWVFRTFNERTNVCCEFAQLVKIVQRGTPTQLTAESLA